MLYKQFYKKQLRLGVRMALAGTAHSGLQRQCKFLVFPMGQQHHLSSVDNQFGSGFRYISHPLPCEKRQKHGCLIKFWQRKVEPLGWFLRWTMEVMCISQKIKWKIEKDIDIWTPTHDSQLLPCVFRASAVKSFKYGQPLYKMSIK